MKMKNWCFAAALVSAPLSPLVAQDAQSPAESMEDVEALAGNLADMFPTEALTPAQEARLPQAEAVVARIFPEGTYARLMDETMEPMMNAIMGSMKQVPLAQLRAIGGMDQSDLAEMGDARLGDIIAILDPAYEERSAVFSHIIVEMVGDLVGGIAPSSRAGLARAYAVRFARSALVELGARTGRCAGTTSSSGNRWPSRTRRSPPHRRPEPRRRRRFVQIRLRVDEAPARAQAEAGVALLEREDQPPICSQNPVSFAE